MATLTGKLVADTYKALLKLIDNDVVTATEKQVSDGYGGGTGLFIDQNGFIRASKFTVTGGNSSQFLKGDGSLDSTSYLSVASASSTYLTIANAASTYLPIGSTTSAIAEGSRLYFTEPRVLATPLTGFVSTSGNVTSSDTVLSSIEKIWWNIVNGGGGGGGGYVPYVGATQDLNLGTYGLISDFIQLNTTNDVIPTSVGVMSWNNTDGTANLKLKGGNVTLQIGQEQVARVVNGSGGTLLESNYQVVKIIGAQGQRLQVGLAQADNDANSKDTIGIVTETIANNQEGFITTSGLVNEIDTTGDSQGETWVDGDTLYLSGTTAGAITNVKPQAPTHTVIVGFVVYAHQNHGKIFVKVDNGYELDELHNVQITSVADKNILVYDSTLMVWQNQNIFGTQGYLPFYDDNLLMKDSVIYTNGTNVGIGSTTLTEKLVVNGNILASQFKRVGGLSTQFLKADGSIDSTQYQPYSADLTAIDNLALTTGLLRKNGTDTWELDQTEYISLAYGTSTYQTYANLSSNLTASATKYPSVNAVNTGLGLKLNLTGGTLTGDLTLNYSYPKIALSDISSGTIWNIENDGSTFELNYGATNKFYIFSSGNAAFSNDLTANKFIKAGGLSTEFLKADGSVDSTNYQPYDQDLTAIGALALTTGLLRKNGTNTWELDQSEYITLAYAGSTYQLISNLSSNLTASSTKYPSVNAVNSGLNLRLALTGGTLTGDLALSYSIPTIQLSDTSSGTIWNIQNDGGGFEINSGITNKFVMLSSGNATFVNDLTANKFIKSGGTSAQFLMADGSVSSGNAGTVTSVGLSAPTGFSVSGSPVTSSGTLALGFAVGYSLPSDATQATWTAKQNALNGTGFVKIVGTTISYDNSTYYLASNPSGYISGITSGMVTTALGYTPVTNARQLTINGTTYDLSADRSWTISGTIGGLTSGYIPKATSSSTLGNSLIYDDGSGIGISGSAYATLTLNSTNANSWGTNVNFQQSGTAFGYIGSYGSLVGSTTKDMTIWANAGNGFRVNVNNSSTTAFFVNSSSNVGIGTTTINVGGWSKAVTLQGSANAAYEVTDGTVRLATFVAASTIGGVSVETNHPLGFYTNSTERMRLTSGGNLLVGTTTDSGYKLRVNGTGYFDGSVRVVGFDSGYYNENVLAIGNGTNNPKIGLASVSGYRWNTRIKDVGGNGEYVIRYEEGSLDALILNRSGNLGLGVTPSAWSGFGKTMEFNNAGCYVGNSGATSMQVGANNFFNGSNYIYSTSNVATRYAQVSGQHLWYTAPSGTAGDAISFTQAMTLDASGNLGVGTTTPGRKLEVYSATSDTRIAITNSISGTGSALGLELLVNNANAYVYNYMNGNLIFGVNSQEVVRFTSGGNVLIGTTSDVSGKLQVRGRTNIWGAGNDNSTIGFSVIDNAANNYNFYVLDGGNTYTRGNVLIGNTTDSGYKLDVNGTGRFSGALTGTSATFSGNLGLGATSSAYKLRILTDNTLDNGIYLSGGTSSSNHAFYVENKLGTAEHFAVRGDGQIRLNSSNVGNVIIGTNSDNGSKFQVNGAATFSSSVTATSALFSGDLTVDSNTLFVDSANNSVGIGTLVPKFQSFNRELTVSGGTSGTSRGAINIQGSRTTNSTFGSFAFYHQTNYVAGIESSRAGADNSGNLQFFTTNAGIIGERLTIASTGAATFSSSVTATSGTFTQSAGNSLQVFQTAATNSTTAVIRQTGAGGNGNQDIGLLVDIQGANDADRIANFRYYDGTNYNSRMVVTRGGNIGIGTTSPISYGGYTSLHIGSASSQGLIKFGTGASADGPEIYTNSSKDLYFNSDGLNTRLIIKGATGNVGIGTTSPSGKLDILGANNVMNISGTNAISAYLGWYYNTSTLVGYIGNGSSILTGALSSDFIFRSEGNLVYAAGGNTERMRITSGGNVLIGTTTDSGYKLRVNGSGYFDGNMFFGAGGDAEITLTGYNGGIAKLSNNSGYNANYNGLVIHSNYVNANSLPSWAMDLGGNNGQGTAIVDSYRLLRKPSGGSYSTLLSIASTGAATFSSSVSATGFFETSDKTIKTLLVDNYQTKGIESITAKLYTKHGKEELGYFAQDVQGILPSAVTMGTNGLLNLSYREVLVAKVQSLEERVLELETQLNLR